MLRDLVANLAVAVVAVGLLPAGGRRGGAEGGEDLERAAGLARHQPELDVALAVDVGKFVRALDVPRRAVAQHEVGLVLGREHRAFDMLVRFAKAGHGPQARDGAHLLRRAGPRTARTGPGDALAADDDVPVLLPAQGWHVEHRRAAQQQVGFLVAERDAHEALAGERFVVEGVRGGADGQAHGNA